MPRGYTGGEDELMGDDWDACLDQSAPLVGAIANRAGLVGPWPTCQYIDPYASGESDELAVAAFEHRAEGVYQSFDVLFRHDAGAWVPAEVSLHFSNSELAIDLTFVLEMDERGGVRPLPLRPIVFDPRELSDEDDGPPPADRLSPEIQAEQARLRAVSYEECWQATGRFIREQVQPHWPALFYD